MNIDLILREYTYFCILELGSLYSQKNVFTFLKRLKKIIKYS